MKDDFKEAAAKAELYAEQAVVVTLGFSNVKTKSTGSNGLFITEYTPKDMKKDFLKYLNKNKIPHAVIGQEENSLTIALPKEDGDEFTTTKAREVIHGFFKDGRQVALSMESYYQKKNSMDDLKNKLLSPFSSTRREVNRNVAKFKK